MNIQNHLQKDPQDYTLSKELNLTPKELIL